MLVTTKGVTTDMTESPRSTGPISRRAVLAGVAGTGLAGLLAACSATSTAAKPRSSATGSTSAASPSTASQAAVPGSAGASTPAGTSAASTSASATKSKAAAEAQTVSVHSIFDDGTKVGVGMPIVLLVDPAPTDASAFVEAATVKVNGKAVQGAWRWSTPYAGEPMQAHFRLEDYWPANSTIDLHLPIGGLSAGKGLTFSGALTSLRLRTGDKVVTTVDGATERAVVMVNDKHYKTMRVSLGASETPTTTGTKLVMQKGEDIPGTNRLRPRGAVRMQNTAHTYDLIVDWSVRVTTSGEYLHDAYWNHELGQESTSDGCTNLSPHNAKWFYHFATIGDVVIHKNTGGDPIQLYNGYTDWNIPWSTYQKGGELSPV